jgi:hypothetical protein
MMVLRHAASLRCAASILGLYGPALGHDETPPHWTTGRLWLLRIGLAALLRVKPIADDWAWMIDHSIQIGQTKVLVILGIRLSELPVGRALCHADMELIALEPMKSSTKHAVDACLEEAVAQTGVPRVIVNDHGADLHGGVGIFRSRHTETTEVYDIKHKAACLLKARLEKDERWKQYTIQLAQTKFAIQQTELAPLVPPNQPNKARFMNLSELVDWGQKTLVLVDDPSRLKSIERVSAERVEAKLGWLKEFRAELREWSGLHAVIEATLNFVRCQGLYLDAALDLAEAVPARTGPANELRTELIEFVTIESSKARFGERLPGSTEVLESSFGKLKAIESDQSKSGFTGLVLSLGAMVSKWDGETIGKALERVGVHDVLEWCRRKLGISVQARRNRVYRRLTSATNTR